ncbi:MAG: hypothetical protein WCA21_12060 [Terracidiphilus sp.]
MNAPVQPAQPYPMTFGQILDRVYRLMRAHCKLFIGIAALPAAAMILFVILLLAAAFGPILSQLPNPPNPAYIFHWIIPEMLLACPLMMAVSALYLAASIHAAIEADHGVTVTVRNAYEVAWKRTGRYLWLLFLAYMIALFPALAIEIAMFAPMALFALGKTGSASVLVDLIPVEFLLYLAALIYGVIMALRLSLAFPASLSEDLTARAAIRRSGQLTQGAKGRIFLVLLVVYAFAYVAEMAGIVIMAMLIAFGVLIGVLFGVQMPSAVGIAGIVLAALCFFAFLFLWSALVWAAFSTSFAVFYRDQKLRHEGTLPAPLPSGAIA